MSVSIGVSGHTRGIQALKEATFPLWEEREQRCFFREIFITVEQTA